MKKKILKISLLAFALLIAILGWNTFRFQSKQITVPPLAILNIDNQAVQHLSQAIQCPTNSYDDRVDTAAFYQLKQLIYQSFPTAFSQLKVDTISQFSYLIEWKGKDETLKPIILMGHTDVVPVEGESLTKWTEPPYSGAIKDSFIWGRGSLDDKIAVFGILEAAEFLLKQKFQPNRTVYFAFGHDEEVGGKAGAKSSAGAVRHHTPALRPHGPA